MERGMEGGKQILTMHVFLTLLSSREYMYLWSLGREMPPTSRNLMVSFLSPDHSLTYFKYNDFINSWRNALRFLIFTQCQLLPDLSSPPSSLCSPGLSFLLSLTPFTSSLGCTTTPGSGTCPGMWSTYQGQVVKEKLFSLSHQLADTSDSSAGGWAWCCFSLCTVGFCLA